MLRVMKRDECYNEVLQRAADDVEDARYYDEVAPPQLPPWATFQYSPEAWVSVLKSFGTDETAAQELFALAQMGERGKREALWILLKLLKKRSDMEVIYNSSAFVHRCVKQASEQM